MVGTSSRPLAVARQGLIENNDVCTILRESTQRIEFLMKANDGTSFCSRIEHRLSDELVIVGMQHQQKFLTNAKFEAFSRTVDRSIKKALERAEDTLAGYVIPAYDKKIAVLQYVVPVFYSSLCDEEYKESLGNAMNQCSKAMSLIFSIIGDTCDAGRPLTEQECTRSVFRGYALLTPPPSAEQATGRPN